jgi:hypothetical protein
VRSNQHIPDDMPLQEFDYEDAAFILLVKPDGSWGIDIQDERLSIRDIAEFMRGIVKQLRRAE